MSGPAQSTNGSHPRYGGPAQVMDDSQGRDGGPAHHPRDSHTEHGGPAVWDAAALDELRAAAENLHDLIEVRKAAENRARTLGHLDTAMLGLDTMGPDGVVQGWVTVAEKAARKALMTTYGRAVPLAVREWAASVPGFASGELFPRIIAIIGDPTTATPLLPIEKGDTGRGARSQPAGPPYLRTPHGLWQWTGMGDSRSKAKEEYLGRPPEQADMLRAGKRSQIPPLLYTWSVQLVKGKRFPAVAGSVYWKLYTERKALTSGGAGWVKDPEGGHWDNPDAARKHEHQCQNHRIPGTTKGSPGCGTAKHPEWGAPGAPWRPGHVDMDARRVIQKRFLMDLWRVAWAAREGSPAASNPATAERRERRARSRKAV